MMYKEGDNNQKESYIVLFVSLCLHILESSEQNHQISGMNRDRKDVSCHTRLYNKTI